MDRLIKEIISSRTKSRYGKRFVDSGVSPESLGWGSLAQQEQRFQFLTETYWDVIFNRRIIDIGSGFGDFYGHLIRKGWSGNYLGVELLTEFFDVAIERYGKKFFLNIDIFDVNTITSDVSIALGLLNYKNTEINKLDYAKNFIEKSFHFSNEIIFDLLSSDTPENIRDDWVHYWDSDELEILKSSTDGEFSWVLNKDRIPANEYLIYVRKSQE